MIVTEQILREGMSNRGAWGKKQLQAILPEWEFLSKTNLKLRKGWKQRIIGQNVPESRINEFLSLKNAHLKKAGPDIEREESGCPVFPRIDDSNRQEWQDKILRQNPWLSEEVFEPELEPAEAQHMQSIRHETKARKAISA